MSKLFYEPNFISPGQKRSACESRRPNWSLRHDFWISRVVVAISCRSYGVATRLTAERQTPLPARDASTRGWTWLTTRHHNYQAPVVVVYILSWLSCVGRRWFCGRLAGAVNSAYGNSRGRKDITHLPRPQLPSERQCEARLHVVRCCQSCGLNLNNLILKCRLKQQDKTYLQTIIKEQTYNISCIQVSI